MWKAAFSGRSETGSQKKKSSGSSVVSSSTRDERRKSGKSSRGSTYDDHDEGSAYATAPSSRVGEPRGLTESAVNALSKDDELDWEDEDKDARSERRSVKSGKSGRSERHRRKSERSRSGSREGEREKARKEEKRKSSSRRESELSRGKGRSGDVYGERAIPEMGSFEQFPGQYAGGMMGQAGQADHMMSGGLDGGPPQAPDQQFGPTREDSYGAASAYYLDEGQSVQHQPGVRTHSPNMLVQAENQQHLHAASLEANPAQDTGNGSAADFYGGDIVMTEEPQPINKPGKQPAQPSSSSSSKPSKPGRTSSLGTAAAATAALGMAGAAVAGSSSSSQYNNKHHSSSMSNSYQQSGGSLSGKSGRKYSEQVSPGSTTPQYPPPRQSQGANGSYYGPPPGQSSQGTPTRPGTEGSYYATPGRQSEGKPGKHSSHHSNAGMYAAGAAAAGAAGYAAYEMNQRHDQKYSQSQYGGTQYARPSGYAQSAAYTSGSYAGMQQQRGYHEHKGPMTKLKDGFLNLLSTEEDVAKMEMYTEAIGVCKHCFDPRTSPWDAPRRHHYHSHSPRRDSFEDLRRRRSLDKLRKHGSKEYLGGRVDKDSRYYASDSKRKSGSKADLAAAGLAGVGLAAGANALFNSGKDFEDTYSVKSGHRPSSASRRRSRSSSREQRRKSQHGVIGRDTKDDYVFVRTKDGRSEKRRVQRSRSRSNDGRSNMMGAAAGAALGASAIAAGSSRRRHSRSRSRSNSPGLAGILGFSDSKSKRGRQSPNGSYYDISQRPGRDDRQSTGVFGGFFTSPPPKRRNSQREHRKKKAGFFNFGNGSSSSSDDEMAFGEGFSSKTNLPLRRKSSNKNVKRRGSDQRLAATVAGIGATAAALAAAQKGNRVTKRMSRPELGAKRRQVAQQDPSDEDWEDELPSDASSGSSLAFGDYDNRLSRRLSKESMTSNGSGAGGLGAWGWRWGGKKERKKRPVPSPPPAYPPRPDASIIAPAAAAGMAAVAARDAMKPTSYDSRGSSMSGVSQPPMQYVDPRPVSEESSTISGNRFSMPGSFDDEAPRLGRPAPTPLQQPQPIAPIQPAFTDRTNEDIFERPKPRRTMSSPTQSSFGMGDAALIGAAAIGTASIIASQSGRRSKEPKDVRFGLTDEQQAKEERDKRKEREKVERNERARADRERALKQEAERHTREQDVLRRREEENRRAAEAVVERDRQAERERKEREAEALRERERQEASRKEEARKAEDVKRQDEARRQREAEIDAEIEAKRRELEEQQRRSRDKPQRRDSESEKKSERKDGRDSQSGKKSEVRDSQSAERSERSSSIPWGAVAAGTAAAAAAGAISASGDDKRETQRDTRYRDARDREASYTAREIAPTQQSPELADRDVFDPAFFKRRRSPNRSPSGDRQIEEIARKAFEKIRDEGIEDYDQMIAEKEDYYHEPARSQADVFAPKEILERKAEYKEHAPDPIGGNDVRVASDREGHVFDEELYGPKSFDRSRHAPFGVPKLGLIAPTPPPDQRPKEKKRREQSPLSRVADQDRREKRENGSRDAPVSRSEVGDRSDRDRDDNARDTRSEPGGRKSSRSRSISWGEPQTHVYEPRTPESFRESSDGFFDAKDIGVGAAAAATAAAAAGGAAAYASSRDKDDDKRRSDQRNGKREDDDVEEVIDITPEAQSGYRKPFYEYVSDLGLGGFGVDSPGTEGAPRVQGFVEGDVDEIPKEEKAPHIPGSWDDEGKDGEFFDAQAAPSSTSRDLPSQKESAVVVEEPAWEPPLSKKDKKKKDKAAKSSSALEDELPTPPTAEPRSVVETVTPAEDEVPYEMLRKKDKKKRDKAKRSSMLEDDLPTPPTAEPEPIQAPLAPVEEEIPYEMLSKKDKKKRDKLKRSMSEDIASPPPEPEPIIEPEPAWEPPLSKKEQKKREKEAKKQGFADVAAAAMTTAGIAAVAGAAADDDSESWDSTSGKKGKKGKKAKPIERDIRDIEPTADSMPGGWEAEKIAETPPEVVDPFQFQVKDDSPPLTSTATPAEVPKGVDPMDEFSDVTGSKKSKKKAKRDSLRFNEPEVSSPLRSEVPFDDYIGGQQTRSGAEVGMNGHVEDVTPATAVTDRPVEERTSRSTTYEVDDRPLTESPRLISPDDSRSVASEPTGTRERERRRRSKGSEYYDEDETDPYDDVRSVAASEPADLYERRKSKRRSRTDDDDTASVVSSRSRRDKEEDSGKKDKEKKGFFGGLFGKKSSPPPSSKSDGAALSRTSTRESKDGYDEDGERRHRRRRSEYGDDDDTRGATSESRHHHRRGTDEEYPRSTSESGSRHHHRRRTDDDYHRSSSKDKDQDGDQSFLGMRVEGMPPLPADIPASSSSAKGFGSPGRAGREAVESGELKTSGERVFQGPGETVQAVESGDAVREAQREKALRSLGGVGVGDGSLPVPAEFLERDVPTPGHVAAQEEGVPDVEEAVEYLPALPESPPNSPTEIRQTHTPHRPVPLQRPTSTTAVPLRFPFGQSPSTPGHGRMERAVSFGGHLPSTPTTPHSQKTRQNRPMSTEIKPLYLVESTRKTPQLEETLPSLPSSKPSSRASSIVGSDEYESAAEDWGSPEGSRRWERGRGLAIDTESANAGYDAAGEDYLDSQQTTPKATERPSDPFEKVGTRTPGTRPQPEYWTLEDLQREQQEQPLVRERQQPQYYTWEDYERDEALHRQTTQPEEYEEELPALPPSRPQSRTERKSDSRDLAKGVAAAALAGGAAVLGYNALKDRDGADEEQHRDLPAEATEPETEFEKPSLSRTASSSSKKKKKGKKGKKAQAFEDALEEPESSVQSTAAPAELLRRDTETFIGSEKTMEEGEAIGEIEEKEFFPPSKPNQLDRFLQTEEELEAGGIVKEPAVPSETREFEGTAATEQTLLSSPTDAEFFEAEQHAEEGLWPQQTGAELSEGEQTRSMAGVSGVGAAALPVAAGLASISGDDKATTFEDSVPAAAEREQPFERASAEKFDDSVTAPTATEPATLDQALEQLPDAPAKDRSIAETMDTSNPHMPILEKQSSPGHDQEIIAVPAPVEASTAVDVEAQPEAEFTPLLTRKQLKKAKKSSKKSGAKKALDDVLASDAAAESSTQDATDVEESASRAIDQSALFEDTAGQPISSVPEDAATNLVENIPPSAAEPPTESATMQPGPDDEWETRPSLSRKQSKKNKKKQKQRLDIYREDESQKEADAKILNQPGLESGIVSTLPATVARAAPQEPSVIGTEPLPESVPLPDFEDQELLEHVQSQPMSPPRLGEAGIVPEFEPARAQEETEPIDVAAMHQETTDQSLDSQADRQVVDEVMTDAHAFAAGAAATRSEESRIPPYEQGVVEDAAMQNAILQDTTLPSLDVQKPIKEGEVEAEPSDMLTEQTEASRDVVEPIAEPMTIPQVIDAEQQAPQPEPEDEFSWSTGAKKKGKKGKKGKKLPTSFEQDVLVPEQPVPSVPEDKDDDVAALPQTDIDEAPQVSRDVDMTESNTVSADADEFWAPPSKKKKKGKKGVSAVPDAFAPEQEPISSAQADVVDTEMRDMSVEPTVPSAQSPRDMVDPEPATPAVESEDFWAPTSGKKNKGKKGKKSEPETPVEVEEAPPVSTFAADQMEPVAVPDNSASAVPLAEQDPQAPSGFEDRDFGTPISGGISQRQTVAEDPALAIPLPDDNEDLDAQAEAPFSVDEQYSTPAETAEGTPIGTPAVEEEMWAVPVKKKGKKGKERQTEPEVPAVQDEPALPAQVEHLDEDAFPSVSADPLPQDTEPGEDVFWVPTTSKKKKGKKGKNFEPGPEPEPLFEYDDRPGVDVTDAMEVVREPSATKKDISQEAIMPPEVYPGTSAKSIEEPGALSADTYESQEPAWTEQDDFWAPPSKKKKGKKGKKSGTQTPVTLPEPEGVVPTEPDANLQAPATSDQAEESTTTHEHVDVEVPSQDPQVSEVADLIQPSLATEPDHEESSLRRDEQPTLLSDIVDLSKGSEATTELQYEATSPYEEPYGFTEIPQGEPHVRSDANEAQALPSSVQKCVEADTRIPEQEDTTGEIPAARTSDARDLEPVDRSADALQEESSNQYYTVPTDAAPFDQGPPAVEPRSLEAEPPLPTEDADSFWAPISKKKKKGRKGRQSTADFFNDQGELASPGETDAVPDKPEPAAFDADPVPAPEDSLASTVAAGPVTQDTEAAWAAPTTGKKGKKGKKGKRAVFDDVETFPDAESAPSKEIVNEGPALPIDTSSVAEGCAVGSADYAPITGDADRSKVDMLPPLPDISASANEYMEATTHAPEYPGSSGQPDYSPAREYEAEYSTAEAEFVSAEAASSTETAVRQTTDPSQERSVAFDESTRSGNMAEDRTTQNVYEQETAANEIGQPQLVCDELADPPQPAIQSEDAADRPAEDEVFEFSSKKSKKDKKKAKKSKPTSANTLSEEPSETTEKSSFDDSGTFAATGALATGAIAAAAVAASAPDADADGTAKQEDEEWPSFSIKKSKKDKRKAKKSGSTTPATPLEADSRDIISEPMDLDEEKDKPVADIERNSGSVAIADVPHGKDLLDEQIAAEEALPAARGASDEETVTTIETDRTRDQRPESFIQEPVPAEGRRDIDFAATVAAGLQDSGFDPDMVVNDPTFHRRATPPGGVGEADPEEVFESFSKKKKKKGKKGTQAEATSDEQSRDVSGLQTPRDTVNEFDEVLAKSLEGTGVDPSALEQMAAGAEQTTTNDLTGEGAEFSFATTKRRKGKKKLQAIETEPPVETRDATTDDRVDPVSVIDELSGFDAPTAQAGPSDEAPAEGVSTQNTAATSEAGPELSRQLTVDTNTTEPTSTITTTPGTPLLDPAADLVHAGERDMDVDDMDKAYRAYKRNKRKQKKQKWAALQAEESASETPQIDEAATPVAETVERIVTTGSASTQAADAVSGQREGDRVEQVDFVPADEGSARGLPAVGQYTEDYLHTSEISQNLPTAIERTPSPSNQQSTRAITPTEEDQKRTGTRSLSGTEAVGVGVAAGAAALGASALLERSSSRRRERSTDSPHLDSERSLGLQSTDKPSSWSFENLKRDTAEPDSPVLGDKDHQVIRDSGYQEASSPRLSRQSADGSSRATPAIQTTKSKESLHSRRSNEALYISTDPGPEWNLKAPKKRGAETSSDDSRTLHARTPSQNTQDTPLEPTSRNRASYLFQTTPENLRSASLETEDTPTHGGEPRATGYFPIEDNDRPTGHERSFSESDRAAFSPPPTGIMSPRIPLDTIPEEHLAHKRSISAIDAKGPEHKAIRRTETPQSIRARERALSPTALPPLQTTSTSARSVSNPGIDELARHSDMRSPSVMSSRSNVSANHWKSPDGLRSHSRTSNRSNTPSLRRTSLSGDLRAASRRGDSGSAVGARSSPKTIPFEAPPTPPSNDDEVMDAGASRSVDMSDVYQGYGDAQGSQVSPTRPPSMRKRQSMHIMDLESRLEQLAAENEALQSAKQSNGSSRGLDGQSVEEALRARDLEVQQKDNEISQIRAMLQPMQDEIARLTEMNDGLTEANRNLVDESNSRHATLQEEHAQAREQWQSASRELDGLRQEHGQLTSGLRAAVEAELATALASKNSEIRELREELDVATEKIRALQVQIQSTKGRDFLTVRDEDYFDGACQKLCQHVQQWVLRFSKVSDNRICRLSSDLKDDKTETRLDNAVLDGSDVDKLLGDRVRRRDVFMSVVMTMVWEFVFTRYLFGMDREQRQKLKALEKLLMEVGPPRAVAQWRATTLTLLAKRPAFTEGRDRDEQAVAHEIFELLCKLLPPPSNNEEQLLSSLQRVVHIAVDLSIEMRTQRSEYIMLPPLLPEYDTNGDLMHKVHFNASLMNERSGMFTSNEELEQTRVVVKIVLFPLVVKKGDEAGEGEEEIVVCPAQVLVQNDNNRGKKVVRVESGHMTIDDPRRSRQSLISGAGSTAF